MGVDSQPQYFVARSEGQDGTSLGVFFAPPSDRLVFPKEVLRAKSAGDIATASLWGLITGRLLPREDALTTIEPSSIEEVKKNLDDFLRTQPADELFVDDDAPADIKEALQDVQDTLRADAQAELAEILGLVVPEPQDDTRPYPGLYL